MAKIRYASASGKEPIKAQLAGQKAKGASSISVNTLDGWRKNHTVDFIIYALQDGNIKPGSATSWTGLVGENTITNLELRSGIDQMYPSGSAVVATPTSAWGNDLVDALLTVVGLDGGFKQGSVNTVAIAEAAIESKHLAAKSATADKIDFSTVLLDYKERTESFHIQGTTPVAIPDLTAKVTIPAGVTKVRVEAYSPILYSDQPNTAATIAIWKGNVGDGTKLQEGRGFQSGGSGTGSPTPSRIITVTPGESVRFSVSLQNGAHTWAKCDLSATNPAYLLVQAVG